jgi:hypothetical protein
VLDSRFPERVLEKAVERMIPRGPLGRQQMRNLRVFKGTEHDARRPEPRAARRRRDEPQEQGGRIMSDTRQSLADLGALTGRKPAPKLRTGRTTEAADVPQYVAARPAERPAARAAARQAGPRLCYRPP